VLSLLQHNAPYCLFGLRNAERSFPDDDTDIRNYIRREKDGVHWNNMAHRVMTYMFLARVSTALRIDLPDPPENNEVTILGIQGKWSILLVLIMDFAITQWSCRPVLRND